MPQTIKGEIESWAKEPNKFNIGNRGSLGMKVENQWHNLIDKLENLEKAKKDFPAGSIVEFEEEQNKRGYFDIIEGTLKMTSKKEAYAEPQAIKPTEVSEQDANFKTCFEAAVKIQLEVLEFEVQNKDFKLDRDIVSLQIIEQTKKLYRNFNKAKAELAQNGEW